MVAKDSVSLQQNESAQDIWRSNSGTKVHKGFANHYLSNQFPNQISKG